MKKWVLLPQPEPQLVDGLANALRINRVVASLLASRGYDTPEKANEFLNPTLDALFDPFLFSQMDRAVERVKRAIRDGERVVVYGDYDVDGTTGTSLLLKILGEIGARVSYYIPNRLKEGYGLSESGVKAAEKRGASLIITVDCGVSARKEVDLAKSLGIDVLVTDHHQLREEPPDAKAILNPKLADETYPDKELAGVGVAYKLCQALVLSKGLDPVLLREHLDLVALGTVADIVPLTGENRIFARFGLERLQSTRKVGLKALIDVCGLTGKPVGAYHAGFILGPRLNAVGRMSSAREAVRLLTTRDKAEAERLAQLLDAENSRRRKLDGSILEEAISWVEEGVDLEQEMGIVLGKEGWHEGVAGIVASRLVEKYNRPTIVIALDGKKGKGSGRSIPGFHLYDAIRSCQDHLIAFGGHQQAVGLAIEACNLEAFRREFRDVAAARISKDNLTPRLILDAPLPIARIEEGLLQELDRFAPFGSGNPRPLFLGDPLEVVGCPKVVGENHLRFKVREGDRVISAIGFGLGDFHQEIEIGKPVFGIAFTPEEDQYLGESRVQLRVRDIRDRREEGSAESVKK